MYKKSLLLLSIVLFASPMVALAEENTPLEQPKKYGRKKEATMNPYLERFLSLVGAAVSATAGVQLFKFSTASWNSHWAKIHALQQEADKLLLSHLDTVAKEFPTLNPYNADGSYTKKFKFLAKAFMPSEHEYCKIQDRLRFTDPGYGELFGWVTATVLVGYAGYLLYHCFTIKNSKTTEPEESTQATEQNT